MVIIMDNILNITNSLSKIDLTKLKDRRKQILTQIKISKKEKHEVEEIEKMIESIKEMKQLKEELLYDEAIKVNGIEYQFNKFIEESTELNLEIIKMLKGNNQLLLCSHNSNLISEIVDVEIVIQCLKKIVDSKLYEQIKEEKLNKLLSQLENK